MKRVVLKVVNILSKQVNFHSATGVHYIYRLTYIYDCWTEWRIRSC